MLAARHSPVVTYVQQIDLIAEALPARISVSHLHFGSQIASRRKNARSDRL
jgi:hypothetical protein